MRLVASAIICAVALHWVNSTYFNGTYFRTLQTVISQMVVHY